MTALDTSVCVPALVGWHEHHGPCRLAAAGGLVPSHVLLEAYSVLTRLPAPHRLHGQVAERLLSGRFRRDDVLVAPPSLLREIVPRLAELGIEGGAAYDGLIALTAAEHRETLVTRDRRAVRTYELLGVPYELVEV